MLEKRRRLYNSPIAKSSPEPEPVEEDTIGTSLFLSLWDEPDPSSLPHVKPYAVARSSGIKKSSTMQVLRNHVLCS